MVSSKSNERRLLTLLELAGTIGNSAASPREAFQTCLECVCREYDWPVGHVYVPAAAPARELVPEGIWHLDDPTRFKAFREITERTTVAVGASLPGRVFAEKKPVWIVDVNRERGFLRTGAGVATGFACPVMTGDQVEAVLEFFSSEPREPDPLLVEVMAHVGLQLGRVVERRGSRERERWRVLELFRSTLEHAPLGILIAEAETLRLLHVNRAFLQMLGRTESETVGKTMKDMTHPDDIEPSLAVHRMLLEGRQDPVGMEKRYVRNDGSIVWASVTLSQFGDPKARYRIVMVEDITSEKRALEALRDTAARQKALLAALPDPWHLVRRDGTIVDGSGAERSVRELMPQALVDEYLRSVLQALNTGKVQTFEYRVPAHGEVREYETRAVGCTKDEAVAVVRDITEHKRLQRQIIEVGEQERTRIGQLLHDDLGQSLAGTALLCQALENRLSGKSDQATVVDARRITHLVQEMIGKVRTITRGLHPLDLEAGNALSSPLRQMAALVHEAYGVSCDVEWSPEIMIEDRSVATNLYWIAHEAVTNAARHGRPKHIWIRGEKDEKSTRLTVRDDGIGLGPSETNDGIGLKIMRSRAQTIGAALSIETHSEGGTLVICALRGRSDRLEARVP